MKRFFLLFGLFVSLGAVAQSASRFDRADASWIRIVPPSAQASSQTVSGSLPLADSRKLGNLSKQRLGEALADEIRQHIGTLSPDKMLSSVELICYGAPSGNARRSEMRGSLKMQELKSVLTNRLAAGKVTVAWIPEDWEGIIRLTRQLQNLPLQAAALDIMEHIDVQKGREQQLKMLAGGETYRQFQREVFTQVQRIDYDVLIASRPVAADGSQVSLQGLYATAANHKPGSTEYSDIIDLAARLFPDNAEAAINAAGVALLRGDVERAAAYLHPWRQDSRADLHLGVMFLLKGDATRAEVHLRLAEAQGVQEATTALRALKAETYNWNNND